MQQVVNIDGTLFPADDAKISVFDRGFLFGDSIYETIRTYRRKPFLIDQHLRRLENSAAMLRLRLPLDRQELHKEVHRTVAATENDECYIRLVVSRGQGRIGLDINLSPNPSYVIIVNPLEKYSANHYQKGVKIAVVSIRRNDRATLNPQIKSSNLLNNVLAYAEANEQGAFEAVLCNLSGYVSECTGSNIFMVHDSVLLTPPIEAGLLEGVTRALTLDLARELMIPAKEKFLRPDELLESQECFITSTTKEIMPVSCMNHTNLNAPGPVTVKLMEAYREFVQEFVSKDSI